MNRSWFKRRWREFRWGHSTYLVYIFGVVNFILITYRLLVEQLPFLANIFPSLSIYVASTITIYIPIAILVGHIHKVKQLKTDLEMSAERNPYTLEIMDRLQRILDRMDEIEKRLP
jgi:hypothetical protein